jgi:glycosyl transferase, family 25
MKKYSAIAFVVIALFGIYFDNIYYFFVREEKLLSDIPVYIISLDRTPGRYKKTKEQLDRYGVKYKRFVAVDGYEVKLKNLKTQELFTGYDIKKGNKKIDFDTSYQVFCPNFTIEYIPVKIKNHINEFLTAGEFGCYCSHMEIWNEIITNKIPYALIFEDDVILKRNFGANLDKVIANIPPVWDLIFLYFIGKKNTSQTNVYNLVELDQDQQKISASVAYFISNKGSRKLLKEMSLFSIPLDHEISKRINDGEITAMAAHPFIVRTPLPFFNFNFHGSTIRDMGRLLDYKINLL